ncbi:MAG: hypothetical protein LBF01_01035, partial [Bacteroidales bacterium]|nr:hypothetical protein [Bacteroidales bacterium]
KIYVIITVFFILSRIIIYGQVSTEERPVSFSFDKDIVLKSDVKAVKSLPSFDMLKINREDKDDEQNGIPPRFGYKHKVDYNKD